MNFSISTLTSTYSKKLTMCRITGIINLEGEVNSELEAQVLRMRDSMTHGGPDELKDLFTEFILYRSYLRIA